VRHALRREERLARRDLDALTRQEQAQRAFEDVNDLVVVVVHVQRRHVPLRRLRLDRIDGVCVEQHAHPRVGEPARRGSGHDCHASPFSKLRFGV